MFRYSLMAAALGIALTGCELPVSVHPVSDEKTSEIDEKLLGTWEMVPPADADATPDGVPGRWVIGRVAGKERTQEIVFVELDGDGFVQVRRPEIFCTTIGKQRFISTVMNPQEPKEKHVYCILLYDFEGDDQVQFMTLNKDVVAPAIDREEIKGVVRKADPDPNAPPAQQVKPKYKEVRLTADPAELRAWLAKQGKALANPASLMTMRRVEVK